MHIMDWDNLRYFLELARAGTLVAAARRLGVDHTTVSRRLLALEKQIGQALFAREAGGHRLTEAGRQLLPQVEAMETAWLAVQHSRPAPDGGLQGLVVDVLALPRLVHLSRREADIVISLERPVRGAVLVVKLTDYALQLYGTRTYLDQHPPIHTSEDLQAHRFISYVDDLLFSKELQFLDALHRPARIALRSTSILAQVEAVRAGAGLAVLPAFLAAQDADLVPVLPESARFTRTFWMSMPAENKQVARMQATWAFLREAVQAQQARLLPYLEPHLPPLEPTSVFESNRPLGQ